MSGAAKYDTEHHQEKQTDICELYPLFTVKINQIQARFFISSVAAARLDITSPSFGGVSIRSGTCLTVIVVLVERDAGPRWILTVIGRICETVELFLAQGRERKKTRHQIPCSTNWQTFYCRN